VKNSPWCGGDLELLVPADQQTVQPLGCARIADWRSMRRVGDVSVIGCVGSLIVGTRGVEGVGEVLLNVRGTKEAYLAWSEEPLPRGTEVLVIDVRGARTVVVEPWPGSSSSTLTS
jgi:membrane-bound ClpP family serine protease